MAWTIKLSAADLTQEIPDGSLKGGAIQRPGPDGKIYPNAIYYASQDIGLAEIARSDDGGFTFGVAIPMWTLAQCDGLHGHIKVAPDGTVYVPNKNCGGEQGVAVSTDNGLSWSITTVDGSTPGDTDPSVGIGADGTVYFGYAESPCAGLGVTVMTDPAGDSLDTLGSHDIRSLHVAEPFSADGSQKLVFTLKMADLADPQTPNTTWRVYFTGADGNGYFVDMRTDVLGAVSFRYGTYIHNADNTQGTATTVGNLDAGSKYDTQTDTITLVVSNSKIGNPQAGGRLSRIFVRVPVVAVVPDNANYASPSTAVGYTLIGNAACQSRPAAPSSLAAVAGQAKGSAILNWADNSDNETNFLVERSTSVAGGYIQIASLSANARSFTDNTGFRKTTYYYRVRAVNSGGKSSYSNVASVKTK